MTKEKSEEPHDEAPVFKEERPGFMPIVILATLLGSVVVLSIVGGIYFYNERKTLGEELKAAKADVRRKDELIVNYQEQIKGLSKHVHALREFSVARAQAVADNTKPPAAPEALSAAAPSSTATGGKAASAETKKPKSNDQDCQLVGKSAEERVATLKRCAAAMDGNTRR